jgi:hypothetical protein
MSGVKHIFVSYVHEDYGAVERLSNLLKDNGIKVWLDRNDIAPGARWKRVIKRAISEGGFFLACFSPSYHDRSISYMNEELALAIDLLRKMPPDRCWFIPVLLADCEVPDLEIGPGETLQDLQQVHLYQDWDAGVRKILASVKASGSELINKDDGRPNEEDTKPARILFLAADPVDCTRLRLSEELREIQGAIISSRSRDKFHLEARMAVRPRDLTQAILEFRPQIIHISGHGEASGGLILENDSGHATFVGPELLAKALKLAAIRVECIVFNVSESTNLAQAILPLVRYAISLKSPILDRAAISFSAGFYQALGNGRSIEDAFKLGCAMIQLEGFPEDSLPELLAEKP